MNKRKIILPLLIVIVALIIGGGIMFSQKQYKPKETFAPVADSTKNIEIRPISNSDHVYGNPDANVLIVEYADLECPSCRSFHPTLKYVMDNYAKSGEVAWVYRHFPVEKQHPNSRVAAQASECVASVAGEKTFWSYIDKLYENSPTSLLADNLKKTAIGLGVDETKYDSCIILNQTSEIIDQSLADGKKIFEADSNFGTPYTILISQTGLQAQLVGNHPLEDVLKIIDIMNE